MPLESSANYIDDLVVTNPTSTDPASQGDDHIRLMKRVLKDTFPGLTAPVNLVGTTVPIGLISAWFGNAASIPAGWALCDGSTVERSDGGGDITTPNLLNKFIRTAGNDAAMGLTGGGSEKTTSEAGSHSHDASSGSAGAHVHTATAASAGSHSHTAQSAGAHSHTASSGAAGSHNHGGSTGAAGAIGTRTSGATALTVAQMPAHRHLVVNFNNSLNTLTSSNQVAIQSNQDYILKGSTQEANVGRTTSEGSGAGHTHSLPAVGSHSHSIETQGNHSHTVSVNSNGAHTHSTDSQGSHTHTLTVDSAGAHAHTVTVNSNGAHTHTVDVQPAYFNLYWIMKI
jgi:hypothetical protein